MAALLASLSTEPAGKAAEAGAPTEPATVSRPEAKVKTMRPRLVLEPWPTAPKRDVNGGGSLGAGLKLQLAQRDLFGGEAADEDEWPEPPAAS